jgi:hypothetical protein
MFTDCSFYTKLWKFIQENGRTVLKYKHLQIETVRVECEGKVIPIITGATGSLSRSFQTHLEDIPGKHSSMELQNTAVPGTAHTFRKILTWNFITSNIFSTSYYREDESISLWILMEPAHNRIQ